MSLPPSWIESTTSFGCLREALTVAWQALEAINEGPDSYKYHAKRAMEQIERIGEGLNR